MDNTNKNKIVSCSNAPSLQLMWIEDIKKLNDLNEIEKQYYLQKIESSEYIIGEPSYKSDDMIGIYIRIHPELPVDESLTPNTSNQQKYIWIDDIYYDKTGPVEVMKPIVELVQQKKYKLGKPASTNNILVGLYKPE